MNHVSSLTTDIIMDGRYEIARIINALGKIPLISRCNDVVHYVRNLPQINTMSGEEIAHIIEAIAKNTYQFSVYYVFNLSQISTMSGEEIAHIINAIMKIPTTEECADVLEQACPFIHNNMIVEEITSIINAVRTYPAAYVPMF
ncbi:MAG: hypothetical protein H6925_05015 [Holosporaceae bacterium]|nr:MAG: hypothetical protein H6925_05015 [Holosporaceae bacterium]